MESENYDLVVAALKNVALKEPLSEAELYALDDFAARSEEHRDLIRKCIPPRTVRQMMRPLIRRRRKVPTEEMWKELCTYIRGENMPLKPLPKAREGLVRKLYKWLGQFVGFTKLRP